MHMYLQYPEPQHRVHADRISFTSAQEACGAAVVALLAERGPLVRGTLLQVLDAPGASFGSVATSNSPANPTHPHLARVRLPAPTAAAAAAAGNEALAAAVSEAETVVLPSSALWRAAEAADGAKPGSAADGGSGAATWATFRWASGRDFSDDAEPAANASNRKSKPQTAKSLFQGPRGAAGFVSASSHSTAAWLADRGGVWGLHTARGALGFGRVSAPSPAAGPLSVPARGLVAGQATGGVTVGFCKVSALNAGAASLPGPAGVDGAVCHATAGVLVACRLEHVELAALAHLSGCETLSACLRTRDPVVAVAACWLVRLARPTARPWGPVVHQPEAVAHTLFTCFRDCRLHGCALRSERLVVSCLTAYLTAAARVPGQAGGAEPTAANRRKAALALAALTTGISPGRLAHQLVRALASLEASGVECAFACRTCLASAVYARVTSLVCNFLPVSLTYHVLWVHSGPPNFNCFHTEFASASPGRQLRGGGRRAGRPLGGISRRAGMVGGGLGGREEARLDRHRGRPALAAARRRPHGAPGELQSACGDFTCRALHSFSRAPHPVRSVAGSPLPGCLS